VKFKEIASRLTGFSVPIFGVSWNPPEPEVAVARRVLAYLEDRRVLFNPYHLEVADQCVHSVLEIRKFLTNEIGQLADDSRLGEHLRGIRAACRKFLDDMPPGHGRILRRVLHSTWRVARCDWITDCRRRSDARTGRRGGASRRTTRARYGRPRAWKLDEGALCHD
jgi:hypothetical protein